MEKLNKLAAPASEKLRQLQKMVEDIKKNDGSILNRLKRFQNEKAAFIRKTGKSTWNRLKNKPPPKLPTRDYNADEDGDTDEWSGSEFDSDTYEDPLEDQDDSYEPPPSEKGKRVFTPSSSASFPRGEYVDSLRDRPSHTHRKPVHPPRDPKPLLPPKPAQPEEDNEDYINPEEGTDDDYIEPSEKPAPSKPTKDTKPPFVNRGVKPATSRPAVSSAESDRSNSPDLYEVPDPEDSAPSVSRLSAHLNQTLPPRASPRHHVKKPAPEPVENEEDEYEICDADEDEDMKSKESTLPALRAPKPRPRGVNKPSLPLKPKADLPNTEHEARPMASKNNVQSPLPLPPDSTQSRSPLPRRISSPQPPVDRGAAPAPRNGHSAAEKEAGVYKKAWYASTCDRRAAEEALIRYKKDGAFLVRKSSGQDPSQPYTLVVLYNGRVYNIPVRHIQQSHQYALGREKKGEERFSSVSDIIENHQRNPLVLIDSQNNTKDSTKLQHAVRP
ncbi:B-cell linker protein [Megalops cyprinoides]|uniref:B-cell linker protein n=1 Tax=Megalops cyprinoides TaxID=118141 RepID=UPI0018647C8C|nr:B-cell linker protein [Megalops cyprinoides]